MKIGVVGAGLVGSTVAYAMVMRGVGRSIVLVDLNEARAQAEADDIYHAVPFAHQLTMQAGGYADLVGCRLVVIAAASTSNPVKPACSCSAAMQTSFAKWFPAFSSMPLTPCWLSPPIRWT